MTNAFCAQSAYKTELHRAIWWGTVALSATVLAAGLGARSITVLSARPATVLDARSATALSARSVTVLDAGLGVRGRAELV